MRSWPPIGTKSTWRTKGSQELERHWLEDYEALMAATPKNNSRRAWSKADRRWASGKRQIIEGVISQLKDFYGLERHRAKTLGGQDLSIHLRLTDQQLPWATIAPPGGPVGLVHCASLVSKNPRKISRP